MKVIYKYYVEVGYNALSLPKDSVIVHFGSQNNKLTIWVLLDEDNPLEYYELHIVGTGWLRIQDGWKYLGTVQQGEFVWHAFLVKDELTKEILERHGEY
jgi:hypothetical protein